MITILYFIIIFIFDTEILCKSNTVESKLLIRSLL